MANIPAVGIFTGQQSGSRGSPAPSAGPLANYSVTSAVPVLELV